MTTRLSEAAGAGVPAGSTPEAEDLLTAEEVAAVLRVTPAWVYAQTRGGRIPHLRLGRYVRYRRCALDAWMQQVESSSGAKMAGRPRRSPAVLR